MQEPTEKLPLQRENCYVSCQWHNTNTMRDARTRWTSAQTRAGHRHSRAAVAEGSKVISNKFLKYVTICSDTAHWSPMLNESNPPMKGREGEWGEWERERGGRKAPTVGPPQVYCTVLCKSFVKQNLKMTNQNWGDVIVICDSSNLVSDELQLRFCWQGTCKPWF